MGLRSLSPNHSNVRFTFQPTDGKTAHYLKEKSSIKFCHGRENPLPRVELGSLDYEANALLIALAGPDIMQIYRAQKTPRLGFKIITGLIGGGSSTVLAGPGYLFILKLLQLFV